MDACMHCASMMQSGNIHDASAHCLSYSACVTELESQSLRHPSRRLSAIAAAGRMDYANTLHPSRNAAEGAAIISLPKTNIATSGWSGMDEPGTRREWGRNEAGMGHAWWDELQWLLQGPLGYLISIVLTVPQIQ